MALKDCSVCSGEGEVFDPFDDLEMYKIPCPKCSKRVHSDDQIVVAFIRDRAEQYAEESGSRVALENLAEQFAAGEHRQAYRHGELDDLLRETS